MQFERAKPKRHDAVGFFVIKGQDDHSLNIKNYVAQWLMRWAQISIPLLCSVLGEKVYSTVLGISHLLINQQSRKHLDRQLAHRSRQL